MKNWLKGGLIGGIIGILLMIIIIIRFITKPLFLGFGGANNFSFTGFIFLFFYWGIPASAIFFGLGAWVGAIIGRVKSRRTNKTWKT